MVQYIINANQRTKKKKWGRPGKEATKYLYTKACNCEPHNKQHSTTTFSLPSSEKTSCVVPLSSLLEGSCCNWLESCQLVVDSAFLLCEGEESFGGGASCGGGGSRRVTPIVYLQENMYTQKQGLKFDFRWKVISQLDLP